MKRSLFRRRGVSIQPSPRLERGFTLIELLVVVGIVTLIVAIAFPVFVTVREQARRAVCASNLRQWGAILEMYAQSEKRYPVPCFEAGVYGGFTQSTGSMLLADTRGAYGPVRYDIRASLQPYVSSWRIAFCPSVYPEFDIDALTIPLPAGELYSSYAAFYGKVFGSQKLLKPGGFWVDAAGRHRTALMSDLCLHDFQDTAVNHHGAGFSIASYNGPTYVEQDRIFLILAPQPDWYSATLFTDGSVRGVAGTYLTAVDPVDPPTCQEIYYLPDE